MMRAIKNNLIGLANFLCLFARVFLVPHRQQKKPPLRESVEDSTKYASLVGLSVEVISGVEPVFCPKCHVLAAQIRQTNQGTEIILNGKRVITIGGNIIIGKNGKKQTGFPVRCPNGHTVTIPSPIKEGV